MPDQAIHKIMTALDPSDVTQLAMIECLRSIADGNKKLNTVLEGVQSEVRDVRERLIRIEATEFKVEVNRARDEINRLRADATSEREALRIRIDALEADRDRREGGWALADGMLKYGPFIIALITALFVVLLATRQIHL